MALTLAITLRCRDGEADRFRRVLSEITPLSQAEERNLAFEVHQSVDDDNVFLVYESYQDEQGYEAHLASEAFKRVEDELFPLLAEREVRMYRSIER